ncbi:hypothetical protein NDU88_005854, partial [Pleurodeles waltl]
EAESKKTVTYNSDSDDEFINQLLMNRPSPYYSVETGSRSEAVQNVVQNVPIAQTVPGTPVNSVTKVPVFYPPVSTVNSIRPIPSPVANEIIPDPNVSQTVQTSYVNPPVQNCALHNRVPMFSPVQSMPDVTPSQTGQSFSTALNRTECRN